MSRRLPLIFALCALAIHLACGGQYGFFRDEMYFLACGRRLAWGYVDQPPLIALVSRLSFAVSGMNVALYRLPAALAHAAAVYLAGRFAQQGGAGAPGSAAACACAAFSPLLLAQGGLLTMNAFEPLLYLAVCMLVAALLRGADERLWLAVGALAGLGILNKHSFAFYAACLLAGLLATPGRSILRSRSFAAGAALAALLVLPHALWQVRSGFPMLELLAAQKWKNAPWTLPGYLLDQLVQLNPPAVLLGLAGLWLLFRELRPLAVAFVLEELLFGALRGKPYYLGPAWLPLFAMGGVALDRASSRLRALVPALVAPVGLAAAPLVLPLLPPAVLVRYQEAIGFQPPRLENLRYGPLQQHLADQFGWDELVQAVAKAAARLSTEERAHAAVYVENYGEAGALELFGSAGLPVVSGHNSYFTWGAPDGVQALLIVGGSQQGHERYFERCEAAAKEADAPWAMPYERERTVWLCRGPRRPLKEIWPSVKHYL